MSLTPPKPLVTAKPGDPITSELWNNVTVAVTTLYDAYNKPAGSLDVTVTDRSNAVMTQATVSVLPSGTTQSQPRAALFVGGSVNRYRVDQLTPGTYDVVVQSDGFNTVTRP